MADIRRYARAGDDIPRRPEVGEKSVACVGFDIVVADGLSRIGAAETGNSLCSWATTGIRCSDRAREEV